MDDEHRYRFDEIVRRYHLTGHCVQDLEKLLDDVAANIGRDFEEGD